MCLPKKCCYHFCWQVLWEVRLVGSLNGDAMSGGGSIAEKELSGVVGHSVSLLRFILVSSLLSATLLPWCKAPEGFYGST
jgi:hypothetical protein